MVQYASFGNFYSNYGNFQNFDFALIFIVMQHTSSYISINSRNTLDTYRMRSFCPCFSHFGYFFHSFQGVFFNFEKVKIKKYSLKTVKKVTKMGKTWIKRPHPINVQCITRIYRYVGARLVHYFKNESQIKILIIPLVLEKISKTSILDHIYIHVVA